MTHPPHWIRLHLLCTLVTGVVSIPRPSPADSIADWAHMEQQTPRGYVCYQAGAPVTIDGRLEDAAWERAPWTSDFLDIEGNLRPAPRLRTRAKMLWDDSYFYIGAELEEPHVWGTLTRHDSVIFQDNDFEVFIDPDGDNHEYYEFEINALNTGWDLFLPRPYKDGGRAEDGWSIPGLQTAVHVRGTLNNPNDRDEGWSIEIAIPWAVLREYARRPAPPRDGDQWRVNFSRVEWQHTREGGRYAKVPDTREDNWVWSPQGIIDMHRPERWGFVQFSTATPGTVDYAPDPAAGPRDALLQVYHHQQAFRQREGRWADRLEDLGIDPARWQKLRTPPRLKTTAAGFRATATGAARDGTPVDWSIRQDSRLRPAGATDDLSDELESLLSRQVAAWNAGNLDDFMEYYWKSDELSFSSGGRTTRGWQATLDNYRRRYPTREQMGELSFGAIEVQPFGDGAALVLGRWQLQRKPAPVGGNFTLLFRRLEDRWQIVHDHTSLEPVAAPPRETAHVTAPASSAAAVEALRTYLTRPADQRPQLTSTDFSRTPLTREAAATARELLWQEHVARIRESRAVEMSARVLREGPFKMPFAYTVYGDKPATGRSLWISLHGGGEAPAELNDQQWDNQKGLYRPTEGVYVAPRAPTNSWNLWHQEHIDRLLGRLIENLIVFEDVDPDRVYLLGYSAGGDGVYQLAPRMADRWAAAAMMAGHPNETSPLGLRNLPFTIHVGGRDTAFQRNQVAADWERKLDELQRADPDGYVHLVKIYPDKGHWMDREDAAALPWMTRYRRNLSPPRIVWKQDDVVHSRFYWLAIDPGSAGDRTEIRARCDQQRITVDSTDVSQVILRLDDRLLDLDQPVQVVANGQSQAARLIPRTIAALAQTLAERGDPQGMFSAQLTVAVPARPKDSQ